VRKRLRERREVAKSTFRRVKGDTETITKKDTNANIAVYRVKAISCIALLCGFAEMDVLVGLLMPWIEYDISRGSTL